MFGYTAPEVVGRPVSVLVPPERLAEEDEAIERIRRGDVVRHFETERVANNGRRIPVSITISPVRTPTGEIYGISRIARDLTERRALERHAFHLAALIDSAEDAIASKDLDGVVQTWNKAAERMFGYSAEEMIGKSIRRIIPRERWHEEDEVLARIRSGRSGWCGPVTCSTNRGLVEKANMAGNEKCKTDKWKTCGRRKDLSRGRLPSG